MTDGVVGHVRKLRTNAETRRPNKFTLTHSLCNAPSVPRVFSLITPLSHAVRQGLRCLLMRVQKALKEHRSPSLDAAI